MRIWHYKLIPFLPTSQLLAQKRECDLIIKDFEEGKKTNHILINYIYEYGGVNSVSFKAYYTKLYKEFLYRGFNFAEKSLKYVAFEYLDREIDCFRKHHDSEYLTICYWNLREKFLRGQKDFTKKVWEELDDFYKKESKRI